MKVPFNLQFGKPKNSMAREALDRRIGATLARLISERATSTSKLAEQAGISELALRNYIEGTEKLPSSESIVLATTLGVTLNELYSGLDEN